jgi:hypothetical protein
VWYVSFFCLAKVNILLRIVVMVIYRRNRISCSSIRGENSLVEKPTEFRFLYSSRKVLFVVCLNSVVTCHISMNNTVDHDCHSSAALIFVCNIYTYFQDVKNTSARSPEASQSFELASWNSQQSFVLIVYRRHCFCMTQDITFTL